MKEVFVVGSNIISPLGNTTEDNFGQLMQASSGINLHDDAALAPEPFYASLFDPAFRQTLTKDERFTVFEQLLIQSIQQALDESGIPAPGKRTLLIISTTKGNISLLENNRKTPELVKRMALHTSAKLVAAYFKISTQPLVVSNACISGLLAILVGTRFIQSGQYDHAIVAGADLISRFILSGFQSFQAVSATPCKPFDKDRTGISLGEAAATIVLSSDPQFKTNIRVMGGATSNDANHISGPSRTGIELSQAIQKALQESGKEAGDIDYISAHGTATAYNDEMEARAIALSGMEHTPVNSLKGYFGHTLGAAGLVESAITIQQMKTNTILPSKGYEASGVSQPVHVVKAILPAKLDCCLKIASGFGGCNGALVLAKT